MTKKSHLIKASVLNEHSAEKSGALLFVYASVDRKIDKNVEFASFTCSKCNTEFAALKGTSPYCVTCGDEDVYEDEDQQLEVETFTDADKELASITCSSCNTLNIVKITTASVLGSSINCVTCGHTQEFQAPVIAAEDEEYGEDENGGQDSFGDLDGDEKLEGDDTEVDFTDSEVIEEEPAEEPAEEPSEDAVANDVVAVDETDDGVETTDDAEADEEMEEEDYEDYEEETLAKLLGKGEFALNRVSDTIIASINSIPVATLAKVDSGNNENFFYANEFASAIKHTVKQVGLEKGLGQFGFSFAKIKIPVTEIVSKRVSAGVQKETAKVNTQLGNMTADFEQCFGIALSALNKGFFKGKSNPLREGFVSHLTTANMHNPKKVVDNVFKTYGQEMNRAAFELAKELMSKSVEFRNEIAEAVGETNYRDAEADDEDESSEDIDLENRLEGAGLKPARKVETSSTTEVKTHKLNNSAQRSVEVSRVLESVRQRATKGELFPKF